MVPSRQLKKYRFFFHYRRQTGGMTVHFKGQCIPCKNVRCLAPCETKWNDNQQPKLVMQGYCLGIRKEGDGFVTIL